MGQKVNANGLRIGINRGWSSTWFAGKKDFASYLKEDMAVRKYLEPKLKEAVLSHIDIGRTPGETKKDVLVTCYVQKVGVALGQDGERVKELTNGLKKIVKTGDVRLRMEEVKNPDLDATLMAKWIASELENRASFRSTQKKAIQRMRKAGAIGCKTLCKGRLGGAEIARQEGYKEGVVPLETLRADIDFAHVSAHTTYGDIGVKVWICRSANKDQEALTKDKEAKQGGEKDAATKTR